MFADSGPFEPDKRFLAEIQDIRSASFSLCPLMRIREAFR
jgi:hypothetical protein